MSEIFQDPNVISSSSRNQIDLMYTISEEMDQFIGVSTFPEEFEFEQSDPGREIISDGTCPNRKTVSLYKDDPKDFSCGNGAILT